MAVTRKMSEIGWFYHAPAKPKVRSEPAELPPASQIPGLSDIPIDPNEQLYVPTRNVIKETDSKYIKLAKGGGRQDLLRFRDFKAKTNEAASYPRNEWFYLEDNRIEEEEQKKTQHWDFRLPEYMVHEPFKAEEVDQNTLQPRERYPYAGDNTSVFKREGNSITDKTVKLPEHRQPGYGYRREKQKGRPVRGYVPPREKEVKPKGELESKPRYLPMPTLGSEQGKPQMGKILSYNYGSTWHQDMKKWQEKQSTQGLTQKPSRTEPLTTEYQENINRVAAGLRQNTKPTVKKTDQNTTQKTTSKTSQHEPTQKELFKLSRFAKVHSKVDTHRQSSDPTMPTIEAV